MDTGGAGVKPYTAGFELSLLYSQAQLSELLGIPPDRVFFLATKPYEDELPELLRKRADYLLELSKLVARCYGQNGLSNWLSAPHPELDFRPPIAPFLGEWSPDDEGAKIIMKLAKWEVRQLPSENA